MDNSSPAWQEQIPSFLAVSNALEASYAVLLREKSSAASQIIFISSSAALQPPETLIGSLISRIGRLSFCLKPPTPAPQPPDFAGPRPLFAPPAC
jgi:hypothetical protein